MVCPKYLAEENEEEIDERSFQLVYSAEGIKDPFVLTRPDAKPRLVPCVSSLDLHLFPTFLPLKFRGSFCPPLPEVGMKRLSCEEVGFVSKYPRRSKEAKRGGLIKDSREDDFVESRPKKGKRKLYPVPWEEPTELDILTTRYREVIEAHRRDIRVPPPRLVQDFLRFSYVRRNPKEEWPSWRSDFLRTFLYLQGIMSHSQS